MGTLDGVVHYLAEVVFCLVRQGVLHLACLFVSRLASHSYDVVQEPFEEPVLPGDLAGHLPTFPGENCSFVWHVFDKASFGEFVQHLSDACRSHVYQLSYFSRLRGPAFLGQVVDRFEVLFYDHGVHQRRIRQT